MATLIASGSTSGSTAQLTGPCTVWVSGDLKGGRINVTAGANASRLVPTGRLPQIAQPGCFSFDGQGTYHMAAELVGAGDNPTCIVETTQ